MTKIGTINWTESHRPASLDEMAMSEENRNLLQSFLDRGEVPHLFLSGPAGCGKTTVAKIIMEELDSQTRTFNASSERGIDTIRDEVSSFARQRSRAEWKIVFLDEADQLTKDAQTALRNLIEDHAGSTRFILTANYPSKVIDPIRSRCQSIKMAEIPEKQRLKILLKVLRKEGVQIKDTGAVRSYAERYTDLRKMIWAAQRSYLQHGELVPASDNEITAEDLLEYCRNHRYKRLKALSKAGKIEYQRALRDMFLSLDEETEKAATWRAILGEAHGEIRYRPDAAVYFLGTCSKLMRNL